MPSKIPWPPLAGVIPKTAWTPPHQCLFVPLLLRVTETPLPLVARAARTTATPTQLSPRAITSQTVTDYLIGPNNLAHVYLSPDPFGRVFDETLDLRKWDFRKHHSGGLQFISKNGRLLLTSMGTSSPGTQIDKWHSRICRAWLQSIDGTAVTTPDDVHKEFIRLSQSKASTCTLTFSHPEMSPDISQHGLPIISRDDYHS
jgi:hypothetical protein